MRSSRGLRRARCSSSALGSGGCQAGFPGNPFQDGGKAGARRLLTRVWFVPSGLDDVLDGLLARSVVVLGLPPPPPSSFLTPVCKRVITAVFAPVA
jgi:hypothetical protein